MTERFIQQVIRDRNEIAKIVIFDNGSDADNIDRLTETAPPWIHLRFTPEMNIHEMWNRGLDECAWCDVVAVLNNDILWRPRALMQSAHKLVISNAQMLLWDNPQNRIPSSGSVKEVKVTRLRPGPAGWAMFLRNPALRFDERFHFYGGDLDMNLRISEAGGKVLRWYRPPAFHELHASADHDSERYRETIRRAFEDDAAYWQEKYPEEYPPWPDRKDVWLPS